MLIADSALGLILPGLIAVKLQDTITTSEERPIHEQVILALIYSYFIYLFSALIFTNWTPLISFKEVYWNDQHEPFNQQVATRFYYRVYTLFAVVLFIGKAQRHPYEMA